MSIKKAIETKRLAEIVSDYENLVLSDNDILFLQFISDKLDKNQLNGLQDWLYDKLIKQVKPKYKEEFNVELECLRFPTHFEIKNLEKLPEEKVLKIFKMFEWVLKKF